MRVLIVEDDAAARRGLTELVRAWGHEAEGAADGQEGLERITSYRPSAVLADMVMPRMDGLELLRRVKDQLSDLTFVLITAQGSVETAVSAMKDGAFDYLTKPVDPQRLRGLLGHVAERQRALRDVAGLRHQLQEQGRFGPLVGNAPSIRAVYRTIEQSAPTAASVLIYGESGTGKELVAKTIHELSGRPSHLFVAINCAAIPESLLESEIFGHERGAFTGAVDRRAGCFELAHTGTLFLDEIAETSPAIQTKLLRVLQERTLRRLGGQKEQAVDVRLIAATNLDPAKAVQEGKLRADLYYRINVIGISVPPLRERTEDIPLLVQTFIAEFNARNGRSVRAASPAASRLLQQYAWPGNIRELRNVIERAVILSSSDFIEPEQLPVDLSGPPPPSIQAAGLAAGMTVDEAERRLIELTLAHTRDNKTRAAEILGVTVKTLHNKLKRFRQEAEEKP
ncbi:MAG: sigma-54 dependent transcriptional regulator [Vicinamibacterales bacterium]|nr:sigma-54 dependent transcriptional regulator [Vicinamibacterales bacterium]